MNRTVERELIRADVEFDDLATREGIAQAFPAFAAEDAIIIRDGSPPLEGHQAILEGHAGVPTTVSLDWYPTHAEGAESGELGYTRGNWRLDDGAGNISFGHYVSVWRKAADESWKYVIDLGGTNPTLTEESFAETRSKLAT